MSQVPLPQAKRNAAKPGLRQRARGRAFAQRPQRDLPPQCSTLGTDSVNSAIGASKRVPSSATIW